MARKREPGDIGRVSKGTSFEVRLLNEYSQLVQEGIIEMRWSDFINQALEHELARYKRERRSRA